MKSNSPRHLLLLTLLLTTLIFSSCVHPLVAPTPHEPRDPASATGRAGSTTAEPNYETLKTILLNEKIPSIAGVVKRIAALSPSYVAAHTLAYQSFSLHESSFENPRAIVFGNTGDLVMTFNGNPSQRSYSNLEVMTFDRAKGYEFREITFLKEPNAASSPGLEESDIEIRTPTVLISKPNPQVCTQCHGERAIPIWQPYFTWPGMYGSDDDNLFRIGVKEVGYDVTSSFQRGMKFDGADLELEGYKRYLTGKKSNARYSSLPDLPFVKDRPQLTGYSINLEGKSPDANEYSHRVNLALLLTLNNQGDQRLFDRIIAKKPTLKQLIALQQAICVPDATAPSPAIKAIPGFKSVVQARRRILDLAAKRVHDEDYGRIYDYYKGEITPDFGYDDDSDPNVVAKPRREQFINKVQPQHSVGENIDEATAEFSIMIEKFGIDLSEYAINLRREPNYENGLVDFWRLRHMLTDEVKKQTGKTLPCSYH